MTAIQSASSSTPRGNLRAAILADRGLQDRLASLTDGEEFAKAASAVAAGVGIELEAEDIRAAIRFDPLGLNLSGNAVPIDIPWPDPAWLPTAITEAGGQLVIDWLHFAGAPLIEPFFEDSVRGARWRPFNSVIRYRTPLGALASHAPKPLRAPDGLIFHMSRCGSTLVAQMLAAIRNARVGSEPAPLDTIVQLAHTRPDIAPDQHVALLRAMAGALGRVPAEKPDRYFIKLDSWHTLALPLFRAAFPGTPWIFLYRDPVEVLVSHVRMQGFQTIPGALPPEVYGIADGHSMPAEEYCARAGASVQRCARQCGSRWRPDHQLR